MNITIKVKPIVMSSMTMFRTLDLQSFKAVITNGRCLTGCSSGMGYTSIKGNDNIIRVYNLEKRRKKVELIKPKKWTKKELIANGYLPTDEKFTTRKVVSKSHWIAYVYDFDMGMLKAAGLRVIQRNRTFTM